MSTEQKELFENATLIAEQRIRQARGMQALEARKLLRSALATAFAKVFRTDEPVAEKAEA